jgi:hypothetical protein
MEKQDGEGRRGSAVSFPELFINGDERVEPFRGSDCKQISVLQACPAHESNRAYVVRRKFMPQ